MVLTLTFSYLAFSQDDAQLKKEMDKTHQESFEALSKGMNPEEIKMLKESMDLQKKMTDKLLKLSPEERTKFIEETMKNVDPKKAAEDYKKMVENMTPEEKQMHEKMKKNLQEVTNKKK